MISFELLRDDGILIVTPEGPLQTSDFAAIAREVDPFIEERGELTGLMIYTETFRGWGDFGALVSHMKFVRKHHRKIARVATVTDSKVLTIIPNIADHFVAADVRHFDHREKDAALAWLKGSAA